MNGKAALKPQKKEKKTNKKSYPILSMNSKICFLYSMMMILHHI